MTPKRLENYINYYSWYDEHATGRSILLDDDIVPELSLEDLKSGAGSLMFISPDGRPRTLYAPGQYLWRRRNDRELEERRVALGGEAPEADDLEVHETAWRLEHEPAAPLERFWLPKKPLPRFKNRRVKDD